MLRVFFRRNLAVGRKRQRQPDRRGEQREAE
jgi:hypothetical protein